MAVNEKQVDEAYIILDEPTVAGLVSPALLQLSYYEISGEHQSLNPMSSFYVILCYNFVTIRCKDNKLIIYLSTQWPDFCNQVAPNQSLSDSSC